MRRTLAITLLTACVVAGGAAPALAANGTPQRPDGPVVPVQSSENGGDNGWGNCGHNSSGGNPPTKAERGNGGHKKGDDCGAPTGPVDPTDPTDPVDPGPIGVS